MIAAFLFQSPDETTSEEVCDEDPAFLCREAYDITGSEQVADAVAFFVGKPLKIILIVVAAGLINRYLRKAITHFTHRVRQADDSAAAKMLVSDQTKERASQRAETLGTVLRSVSTILVWTIAVLLVLGELGVNLAPLLAGAGIAGVALGFGAQSLVKDFLTGFFMLVEDQYGVGDVIDVGDAVGTVERVNLRTTTLRDINGTLWHVPNGEILRVGNKSQLWARALLDVGVGYGADLAAAEQVIKDTADARWRDPDWAEQIEDEPEVLGVQDLAADAVTIRLSVKTEPAAQFQVERELRLRLKDALDAAEIEIPFPQRDLHITGVEKLDLGIAARVAQASPRTPVTEKFRTDPGDDGD